MICEKCRKINATIHLSQVREGKMTVIHLCEKCSLNFGIDTGVNVYSLSGTDMLSFLNVNEIDDPINVKSCLNCGTSFFDFKKTGRFGCSECYVIFEYGCRI